MDIESKIVQACNALPVAFAPTEKSIYSLIEAINKWRAHVLSETVKLKNNSNKFEHDAKSLRIERDALHEQLETTKRELMATDTSWQNALAELQKALEQEPVIQIENGMVVNFNPNYDGDVSNGEFYAAPVPAMPIPKQEPAWAVHDDCCATGQSCDYEICTLNGEQQCKYCGKEHPGMKSPHPTERDDDGLLPIDAGSRPDCRVMCWSESELRSIKDYARRCIAAAKTQRITEQDVREKIILEAIHRIESSHFRTVRDHGASEHAQIVLGELRLMIGLPMVFNRDLPAWDGKKYAVPTDSNLIRNQPYLLNKLNANAVK